MTVVLALVMALLMLAGCGGGAASGASSAAAGSSAAQSAAAPPAGALAITDMVGREVSLDGPAAKIVATAPSDVEILYAIGALDTLVGRGEYCNYPEEVADVPSVSSGDDTNVEQIIALAPDAVVMNTIGLNDDRIQALESAGIRVLISEERDIAGVYENIRMLGALTGKTGEAEAVVAEMQTTFDQLAANSKTAAAAQGGEAKTVYFEVSPLEYGLWTAGGGTFMDELATMMGLENIFADVDGWGEVSEEQVIERNPDYIVTITMFYGEGPTPEEEILARAGWQDMTAVQNKAVLNVDSDMIARPGPRLAQAAKQMYNFIYGEQTQMK